VRDLRGEGAQVRLARAEVAARLAGGWAP
jgi:hypothetical protein